MPLWTDAHNHLQDPRLGDPEPVVSAMRAAGVRQCVVNATCEADWPTVEALSLAHLDWVIPSFGIHPWHAHHVLPGWQERLETLLEKHPRAGLGECGLDQWVSSPSIGQQLPVFLDQLKIARRLERPLTVHCLKAWGRLIDTFAKSAPPRFLMHSFGGSIEIARRLIPLGARFSCSGHHLHPRKAAALEIFRQVPEERIMVETDAPDMAPPECARTHSLPGILNHPANLSQIGCQLAERLGMTSQDFAALTTSNTAFWLDGR
jgi:TatD DNase family protein